MVLANPTFITFSNYLQSSPKLLNTRSGLTYLQGLQKKAFSQEVRLLASPTHTKQIVDTNFTNECVCVCLCVCALICAGGSTLPG